MPSISTGNTLQISVIFSKKSRMLQNVSLNVACHTHWVYNLSTKLRCEIKIVSGDLIPLEYDLDNILRGIQK